MALDIQKALAFHQQGNLSEAEAIYRAILVREPQHATALHCLGLIAHQQSQYVEADRLISQALAFTPNDVVALNNHGNTLLALTRWREALVRFDQALAIKPDLAEALYNRGNALQELKLLTEAIASYDRSLAIKPNFVEALYNRGNAFFELERYADALASFDQALTLRPDDVGTLTNRGNALLALRRQDEALASFDRALALKPDTAETLNNRGRALLELQRLDEALMSCRQALAIKPDYAEAHLNEGFCHLLGGDLLRGWEKYEWRWRKRPERDLLREFVKPHWLGDEDVAGKTLLLHAEQGLGDAIQFCRYVPLVAERGARVVLEVQPALKSLLTRLEGVTEIFARGEALPVFDFHCPLMSLPLALKTTLTTIPAQIPYLSASPEAVTRWRTVLGETTRPRIGLAWSGNPVHHNDLDRSIAPSKLTSLFGHDVTFISLKKEYRDQDKQWLAAHPEVRNFSSALHDFADTAALASLMDVVITVDTSVAHLAGALGLPVWILLPHGGIDWRWRLARDDSPWYPTARLYRQAAKGAWDAVVDRVAHDLRGFIAAKDRPEL